MVARQNGAKSAASSVAVVLPSGWKSYVGKLRHQTIEAARISAIVFLTSWLRLRSSSIITSNRRRKSPLRSSLNTAASMKPSTSKVGVAPSLASGKASERKNSSADPLIKHRNRSSLLSKNHYSELALSPASWQIIAMLVPA